MSRLATRSRRNRFVILRTASSPPVALHPASLRRSYLRLLGCDQPRHGLAPCRQRVLADALMPGEGPASTSLARPALQDVDTGPSPGMTCSDKRADPGDLVISPRILSAGSRGAWPWRNLAYFRENVSRNRCPARNGRTTQGGGNAHAAARAAHCLWSAWCCWSASPAAVRWSPGMRPTRCERNCAPHSMWDTKPSERVR